jgi:hypothetical protein
MNRNSTNDVQTQAPPPSLDELLRSKTQTRVQQRRANVAARKREQLREMLWPGSSIRVWSRHKNKGFTTIPRLLSLVMHLIKRLSPKGDPSVVYFDLWTRAYDEGTVTIADEEASAFSAGYSGTRAVRTWREHVQRLQELRFIEIMPEGNREIAHILLVDPLRVCAELYRANPHAVTREWWTAFVRRAGEIGASIPSGGTLSEAASDNLRNKVGRYVEPGKGNNLEPIMETAR